MQQLFKFTKLAAFAGALLFFSSCEKSDNDTVSGTARVSFTHASPDAPAVDVYVDNVKATATPLTFNTTTGSFIDPYLTVNAGTRNVRVSTNGTINVTQGSIPFAPNGIYSVFVFDTLSAASTLKGLVLQDNLATPAAGKAHIRFLHLSPDADTLNVDFAKSLDTTRLSNKIFAGNTITDPAMGNFQAINAGIYVIILKNAKTQQQLASFPFTFAEGKIYTVFASGLKANPPGTPASLNSSIIIHN